MAGYWHGAAVPSVLADVVLTGSPSTGHQPTAYEVFIAAATQERAARIVCACTTVVEVPWGDTTPSYRDLLHSAWAKHTSH